MQQLRIEQLKNYTLPTDILEVCDADLELIPVYELKDGNLYVVMGEYHDRGALSLAVGARIKRKESLHQVLENAFKCKRLDKMSFSNGLLDSHYFHSFNEKQKLLRLTLIQTEKMDLSKEEFNEKFIIPMQKEAELQRGFSEFFRKLEETAKESQLKFDNLTERTQMAKKAYENLSLSEFPLDEKIVQKFIEFQNEQNVWSEALSPLAFFEKHGGRKYAELTGFYLMPVSHLIAELKIGKLKADAEKPTIFIENKDAPSDKTRKKFFIFEDEFKTMVECLANIVPLDKTLYEKLQNIPSLWTLTKMGISDLDMYQNMPEVISFARFFFSSNEKFESRELTNKAIAYYSADYPETHWARHFPSPEDKNFIAILEIYGCKIALKLNPTDARGYRSIVGLIADDKKKMHTVFNRQYTLEEKLAINVALCVLSSAYEAYGLIVQTEIAGNNSQKMKAQGLVVLGNEKEPSLLHAHLIGRGDPDYSYIGNVPLRGPKPGEMFNMRGEGVNAGNKSKEQWRPGEMENVAEILSVEVQKILVSSSVLREVTLLASKCPEAREANTFLQ